MAQEKLAKVHRLHGTMGNRETFNRLVTSFPINFARKRDIGQKICIAIWYSHCPYPSAGNDIIPEAVNSKIARFVSVA